ncbi:MAG TPA: WhiB family transcriptional regulator [Acidimicrobiales bacterium]|nr:WhiB family transcriptional regulator [Acidimicrobiales bacterium]
MSRFDRFVVFRALALFGRLGTERASKQSPNRHEVEATAVELYNRELAQVGGMSLSRIEALMLPGDVPDVLDLFPARPQWMASAACRDSDPDTFFPSRGEVTDEARELCGECPARRPCLEFALEHGLVGVWGGTSDQERRALRRAAAPTS